MKKMRRCRVCNVYTLLGQHCNFLTLSAHPPHFNPNDPYGRYRRIEKGLES